MHSHDHAGDRDGQLVIRDIKAWIQTSAYGVSLGTDQLEYLTTASIDSWGGTKTTYVLHWASCARRYNERQATAATRLSNAHLLPLLQKSVRSHPGLAQVQHENDKDVAKGNPALTYPEYLVVLKARCSVIDKQEEANKKQNSKRVAKYSQASYEQDDYSEYDDEPQELSVNKTE